MKIQNKITVLLIFIIVLFAITIYLFEKSESAKILSQMNDLRSEKNILLEKATNVLGKSLFNYVYDYTYWDEMVEFVENPSEKWAFENIDQTLETFNAQVAWIFNKDFKLVHSVSNLNDESINNLFLDKNELDELFQQNYFHHFFIKIESGLMEIRTAPIQKGNDYERISTPHGYFIAGRIWNNSYLTELSLLTQSKIDLVYNDSVSSNKVLDTSKGIICYQQLKDINNKNVGTIVAVTIPFGIEESEKIFKTQTLFAIVFAIFLTTIIFYFFIKYVISPLRLITESLNTQNMSVLDKLTNKTNEFGVLAKLIKEFNSQKQELLTEISERQKAEEFLNQNQELLHTLIDSMPDIVCFKDGNGRWLEANEFDLELFDLCQVDYKGKTDAQLAENSPFHTEVFLSCMESDEIAWQAKKITRGEEIIKKPNGETLVFDIIKVPLYYSDGKRKGLVVIGRDITKRKNSEKALQESEKKYRKMFENIQDVYYQTDNDGIILEISPSIERYTGFKREVLIGEPITMIYYNPDDRKKLLSYLDKLGELIDYEVTLKTFSGFPVYMSVNSHNLFDFEGRKIGVEGSIRDATERKIAERELLKAKDKAEESEKLKSEFLAQMSHEIRTPINAILSFSSLIRDEMEDQVEEDLKTAFSIIKRAGKRIIRTIDLILNMSEIQTGTYDAHFKLIDIFEDVIVKSYNELKPYANEKNIDLRIHKLTSQTYIVVDEYTVEQIMNNLIDNAIKYTIAGSVDIYIKIDERKKLCVEIIDTGIGISKQYFPNLFTPFSQEEQGYTRKYEGNGLGLALVKSYCTLNGAEIEVDSEKGKGTTFRVIFAK